MRRCWVRNRDLGDISTVLGYPYIYIYMYVFENGIYSQLLLYRKTDRDHDD